MEYPQYAKVNGKKYKINTDFRVAIECNEIALDKSINDFERSLAIIYKLFGEEGLNDFDNHEKLQEIALKYLSCGKEITCNSNDDPDMDYIEDEGYIRSSFQYDYKYDPYEQEYCHWWKFYNDLCNLSNSEFGSCCILSRIRNIRNYDLKTIQDNKEREKMRKAKESVALKRNKKEITLTKEQQESMDKLNQILGI
jgi:hypothetical protein